MQAQQLHQSDDNAPSPPPPTANSTTTTTTTTTHASTTAATTPPPLDEAQKSVHCNSNTAQQPGAPRTVPHRDVADLRHDLTRASAALSGLDTHNHADSTTDHQDVHCLSADDYQQQNQQHTSQVDQRDQDLADDHLDEDQDLDHLQRQLQQPQDQHELSQAEEASLYYDASTMSNLNPFSLAALNRLRAYKPPPFPLWDTLPTRKRAAVLLLLYADRWGDLRVVITMRAASLRSFSGHAALPGGKADSQEETPYQIARREAYEEIGLPMDDFRLPKPFRIEPLCHLPPSLARTHLVVTPCVAFLHADRTSPDIPGPLVEESLIPRLDPREVAAVFSAPFYNFLKGADLPPRPGQPLPPGGWYEGSWIAWKDMPWRVHNFYVPVNNQRVAKPSRTSAQSNLGEALEEQQDYEGRFKVWGMTGRLLVDAARIAYGEDPEIEHNATYGDYDIILQADKDGVFNEVGEAKKPASPEPAKM